MIEITVFCKNENYTGVCSKGHAGYAKSGNDIICAAVSVLMINTVNSIEKFTKTCFTCEQDNGYLEFHLADDISETADVLIKSLVLGLTDIQKTYGNSYIKIVTKEV